MNTTIAGTCLCECSTILKDYNVFDFMIAHPIQMVLWSLGAIAIMLIAFVCLYVLSITDFPR